MKRTIALVCTLISIGTRANADLPVDGGPQMNAIDGVCESLDRWVGQFGDNPFLTEEDFEKAFRSKIKVFTRSEDYGFAGCLSDPTVSYYAPPEQLMPRSFSGRSHRCITVDRNGWLEAACAGIFPGNVPYEVAIAYREEYCHVDFPKLEGFFDRTRARGRGFVGELHENFVGHRVVSDVAVETGGPPTKNFFDGNERVLSVYTDTLSGFDFKARDIMRELREFDAVEGLVFHNGDGVPYAHGYGVKSGNTLYYNSTKYRKMNLGGVEFTVSYRSRKDRVPSRTTLGKGKKRRVPFKLPYTEGVALYDNRVTVCYDKADGLDLHPAIKYMEFILKKKARIDELSFDFGDSHYSPFDG